MEFTNPLELDELVQRERPRKEDMRGYYFRDITAIIHSYPFRRLKHKTQVFFSPKNDHICTRIEHVMHVATISATICRALGLDVDLAWAISLGHDFGHTPFGHLGERILNDILKDSGGFNHELYSLYVVDHLANYGKGLNLTFAVRDGIISHCGESFEKSIKPDFVVHDLGSITEIEKPPCTWEGAVMRMSDKAAYLGRDLEDAINLKVVSPDETPAMATEVLGSTNGEIIDTLVNDLITTSLKTGSIGFSEAVHEAVIVLNNFNYERIYDSESLAQYHPYFKRILNTLFYYLLGVMERHGFDLTGYRSEGNHLAARFGDYLSKMQSFYEKKGCESSEVVTDYVAGMTDDYAIDCVSEIMIPKRFSLHFDENLSEEG